MSEHTHKTSCFCPECNLHYARKFGDATIGRLEQESATLRAEVENQRERANGFRKALGDALDAQQAAEERLGQIIEALKMAGFTKAVEALASLTEKPPAEPDNLEAKRAAIPSGDLGDHGPLAEKPTAECDCSRARYPYPPPLPSHALNCATQAEKPPQPEPACECGAQGTHFCPRLP